MLPSAYSLLRISSNTTFLYAFTGNFLKHFEFLFFVFESKIHFIPFFENKHIFLLLAENETPVCILKFYQVDLSQCENLMF